MSKTVINPNQYFSCLQDLVMNVLLNLLLKKADKPFFLFSVKGYKSSDDSGNCAHREGAAEDPQENPH